MKRKITFITTLMASCAFCCAQEAAPQPAQPESGAPVAAAAKPEIPQKFKERILAEFDKDKDGYLNDEELAAAKKAFVERKARFEKMRLEQTKKVMEQFDKNRDGVLSLDELSELVEHNRRMMFEMRSKLGGAEAKGDGSTPPPARFAPDGGKNRKFRGDASAESRREGRALRRFADYKARRPEITDLDSLAKPKESSEAK